MAALLHMSPSLGNMGRPALRSCTTLQQGKNHNYRTIFYNYYLQLMYHERIPEWWLPTCRPAWGTWAIPPCAPVVGNNAMHSLPPHKVLSCEYVSFAASSIRGPAASPSCRDPVAFIEPPAWRTISGVLARARHTLPRRG